jgi:Sulfatase
VTKPVVFSLCLAIFSVASWLSFAMMFGYFEQFISLGGVASSLAVFDLFIVEFLLVLLPCIWLISGGRNFRVLAYIIALAYVFAVLIQLVSFFQGHEFLSRLALENVQHIKILINYQTIIGIVFFFGVYFFLPFLVEKKSVLGVRYGNLFSASVVISGFVLVLATASDWIPGEIVEKRNEILRANQLSHTSPVMALYKTLFIHPRITDLAAEDAEVAKKYGFEYTLSAEFPLVKGDVYKNNSSLGIVNGGKGKPNVVVFFTEGFSSRMINAYGGEYVNLTPNIDAFIDESMRVDNYYNHTAATYRGLHGQLCSIFPYYGGVGGWNDKSSDLADVEYFCLSHLLNQNNYETVFLDGHRSKDAAVIDVMMKGLDFDVVLQADELSEKYLAGGEPIVRRGMSDNQLVDSFIGFLKARESGEASNAPFYVGLYNLETHAWIDVAPDGRKYGDGSNNSLNTIYNFDYAFGRFWEYFKQSPYIDNTVVILTADHAHYPEKTYVKVAGEDYQRVFVDEIPLVIYDNSRQLPATFDAKFSTSIDFAPTLAHYLGLPNYHNPFMGSSLFDDRAGRLAIGVAALGSDIYFVDESQIHRAGVSEKYKEDLASVKRYIAATQQLELKNKVWDKRLN